MKDTNNALLQSLDYIKTEIQEFRKMAHKDLEKVKSANAKQNILLCILFMLMAFVYYNLGFFNSNNKHVVINQTIQAESVTKNHNALHNRNKVHNKSKSVTNAKSNQENTNKKFGLINK
ncbi:hypothetical protein HAV_00192 [Candidatus Hepatincola sp. Av]